jgi:hypothetical protein
MHAGHTRPLRNISRLQPSRPESKPKSYQALQAIALVSTVHFRSISVLTALLNDQICTFPQSHTFSVVYKSSFSLFSTSSLDSAEAIKALPTIGGVSSEGSIGRESIAPKERMRDMSRLNMIVWAHEKVIVEDVPPSSQKPFGPSARTPSRCFLDRYCQDAFSRSPSERGPENDNTSYIRSNRHASLQCTLVIWQDNQPFVLLSH